MSDFPKRLKEIRKIKGLTQRQVFTAIEANERLYQSYEYGEKDPSYKVTIKLADFFDVSIDYLVGRSDNPERR